MNATSIRRPTREIIYLRDLLRELVARDIKLRYRRSILGMAWSLLNPLAELLVLTFVFTFILPVRVPNFIVFLYIGILSWTWFRSSLYNGTSVIVNNRELIRLPGFPIAILPVVATASNFIHFLLSLPILGVFIALSGVNIKGTVVLLPLVMTIQFLFTISLIYFLAAVHVTFRDTQYLLGIALMLGFYLSPIFYQVKNVPPQYLPFYNLNPMVHIIESYRSILLFGSLPEVRNIAVIAGISLALLIIGLVIFRRASLQFVEEL